MTTDTADNTESRVALLDASLDAIANRGLRTATPERLESMAGLQPGAFAAAFDNEDEWLLASMGRVTLARLAEYSSALDALAPGDRTLRGGASALWAFFPSSIWGAWLQLFVELRARGLEQRVVALTQELDHQIGEMLPSFFEHDPGVSMIEIEDIMVTLDGMALAAFATGDMIDMDSLLERLKARLERD